jgi:hypothetical protein
LRQELSLNIATLELDDVGNEWVSVVKKVLGELPEKGEQRMD